jgi:hypothetical protein
MNETFFVEKIERGKDSGERAAGFVGSKRTVGKKLAEVFVGEFGDDVQAGGAVDHAAAGMQDAEKPWMRKSGGGAPARELSVGGGDIFGDELDGGVGRGVARMFGAGVSEKDRGIRRDA